MKLLFVSCGNRDGLPHVSQGVHAYWKTRDIPHVWYVDDHAHDSAAWRAAFYHFAKKIRQSSPARFDMKSHSRSALPTLASATLTHAMRLGSPFGDHMVLQRGRPVPVWGVAAAGERITVEFAGQTVFAVADSSGRWRADLAPLTASIEPRVFTVKGSASASITLRDILVGEVWLCGGQSNMERQLGPRPPQPEIVNWRDEAAAARHPLIRQLYVQQCLAVAPQTAVDAAWTVCSPATVLDFTAVGYFFARDLHAALGVVPVGIIHSSRGGTPAEAWTGYESLAGFHRHWDAVEAMRHEAAHPEETQRIHEEKLAAWYRVHDTGADDPAWHAPDLDTTNGWETIDMPAAWEESGRPDFNGIVWLRKTFDLPAAWSGLDLELRLRAADDADTTWVNGFAIGAVSGRNPPHAGRVTASALRATGNVIAVRVLDIAGKGGIRDKTHTLEIAPVSVPDTPLPLSGPWLVRFGAAMDWNNPPPVEPGKNPCVPTVLHNAMIAPLAPYALRGAIFYQGEANADRSAEYRRLLPALIRNWRELWGQGDFPFLFVQMAPFRYMPPEIREAQLQAWLESENTAMVVTLDIGDADDIHPADKAPVGARLALAARALAYGEDIPYSGPIFDTLRVEALRAVLGFAHLGGGLLAKDGPLRGFTVAGADGVFHPADAVIEGDMIVVSSPAVVAPAAVRYGWAKVPEGNLFNAAGLPASPFRTDAPRPG